MSVVNSGTKLLVGGNDGTSLNGSADYAANIIAGDIGGTDNHTVIVPGQTYNISIILDLSGSMKYNLNSGTGDTWGTNPTGTRMEMAVKTLENFFKNSIQEHDGTVNLHLVGFGGTARNPIDLSISATSTEAERLAAYTSFAKQLDDWQDSMFAGYYEEGTNYQAALDSAKNWYNTTGVKSNGGVNMSYFITDGEPTACNASDQDHPGYLTDRIDVTSALTSFANLAKAGGTGVKVSAIGIGTISDQGQKILDMLDNTTANGTLTSTTSYPYQDSFGIWHTKDGNTRYSVGDSDLINTADGLTAALQKGATYSYQGLISVGNDTINGGSSDYVFGDALNTDGIVHSLGLESVLNYGSGYAVFQYLEAHHDINVSSLFPSDPHHTQWTSADTTNYITTHYEQMGWETKVLTSTDGAGHQTSTFYLADLEGNIHNLDGTTNKSYTLDNLTGRTGGDDKIFGGGEADHLFGQEGNDTIHGDAGNDYIYGGSGHDVLYGDAGDDFLFGGSGNDHLYGGDGNDHLYGGAGHDFLDGGTSLYNAITNPTGGNVLDGGAGNDILVFHKGDTIDGGSGIDVLLTDDSTNDLGALLRSTQHVEVAIKGMNAANSDAPMDLTDISKLANVGIHISDSTVNGHSVTTMTLDATKWSTTDNHTFTNDSAHLTLNTNLSPSASHDATEVAKFVLQNS